MLPGWLKWDRKPKNIEAVNLPTLQWDTDEARLKSIGEVQKYVEREATQAIAWYFRKKTKKARTSVAVRYAAIFFTTLAGLFPIVKGVWPDLLDEILSGPLLVLRPANSDLLVSLFAGLAGACLALDQFGGFSTGWIRYIRTATELQKLLAEFRIDWAKLESLAGVAPTQEQIEAMLGEAKKFVSTVRQFVLEETQQWAAEFERNLAQLEKDIKASARPRQGDSQ